MDRITSFKLPWFVRFALVTASVRWLNVVLTGVTVLLVILLLLLIAWSVAWVYTLTSVFQNNPFQDIGFVGIFGSLFGALVGGLLSGGISLYLQSWQNRASMAIKNKENIYIPLYDALVSVKRDLEESPYPSAIALTGNEYGWEVYFDKWSEIRGDSRGVQVPKWFHTILDNYTDDLRKYLSFYQTAELGVTSKITEFLAEECGISSDLSKFRSDYVKAIVLQDLEPLKYLLRSVLPSGKRDDVEHVEKISVLMLQVCRNIDAIVTLRSFYQHRVINSTQWLVHVLADTIQQTFPYSQASRTLGSSSRSKLSKSSILRFRTLRESKASEGLI
ncbi:MAG: hypothetical protein HC828_03195 [Blastochloris sp.]|nr:hypothetical protein [Blastochloris sp.]